MANDMTLALTLAQIAQVSENLIKTHYQAQQIIDRIDDTDLDQTATDNPVLTQTGLTLQQWGQARTALQAFVTLLEANSSAHRVALNKAASVPRQG